MNKADLDRLLSRARGIAALRGVLDSGAGRDFLALLGLLATEKPDPEPVADACSRLWGELAHAPEPLLEDAWQAHLVERFLEGEHPFALAAEKGELSTLLLEQVRRDLRTLRALFEARLVVLAQLEQTLVTFERDCRQARGPLEGFVPDHLTLEDLLFLRPLGVVRATGRTQRSRQLLDLREQQAVALSGTLGL